MDEDRDRRRAGARGRKDSGRLDMEVVVVLDRQVHIHPSWTVGVDPPTTTATRPSGVLRWVPGLRLLAGRNLFSEGSQRRLSATYANGLAEALSGTGLPDAVSREVNPPVDGVYHRDLSADLPVVCGVDGWWCGWHALSRSYGER